MNKYSLFIASLTGISALSSANAGQLFVGASANIERNSYKTTAPDRNEEDEVVGKVSETKSKTASGLSLIGGYRVDVNNFGFITEAGVSVTFGNKISEIEIKKDASLFLTQKVGYSFFENNLTYLSAGVAFTKYKFVDKNKNLIQPIIGLGHEVKIKDNLSLFAELNFFLKAKYEYSELLEIKPSSQQFKIGARYYFL